MKRILALLLLMCLLLTACSNGRTNGNESSSESSTAESTTEEQTSAEETIDPALLGKSGLLKDSTIVFTGDSIVDGYRTNRNDPTDLGSKNNFVSLINTYLQKNFPEDNITVYNTGYSGYTIQDVKSRLKSFVFDLDPDYVIIILGDNNAWNTATSVEMCKADYKAMLEEILEKTDAQIFIIRPYLLESDFQVFNQPLNNFVPKLNQIGDAICEVAAELDLPVIYSHAAMEQAISKYNLRYDRLTSDGIHPAQLGNKVLAEIIAEAMGIEGYTNKYNFDFSKLDAKFGLNGVKKES